MSYKKYKTAEELNKFTQEERLSRCGFSDYPWSQSGSYQSTQHGVKGFFVHTKQNTSRNKDDLKNVLTPQQVNTMRNDFCEELQLTSTLSDMRKSLEEDNS